MTDTSLALTAFTKMFMLNTAVIVVIEAHFIVVISVTVAVPNILSIARRIKCSFRRGCGCYENEKLLIPSHSEKAK